MPMLIIQTHIENFYCFFLDVFNLVMLTKKLRFCLLAHDSQRAIKNTFSMCILTQNSFQMRPGKESTNEVFCSDRLTKTARQVNATPWAFISSRSSIFNLTASSRAASSIIGYGKMEVWSRFPNDFISPIHFKWDSAESHDNAIGFTLRFTNSGWSCATRANSVVQTGVKSAGCEKRIPHLEINEGNWH